MGKLLIDHTILSIEIGAMWLVIFWPFYRPINFDTNRNETFLGWLQRQNDAIH
jgi:hypothetical protein